MPRSNFDSRKDRGTAYAVDGREFSKQQRQHQASAQQRAGYGGSQSKQSTFATELPPRQTRMGLVNITAATATEHVYTGRFRYWNDAEQAWLEYDMDVTVDARVFFDGFATNDDGDEFETWTRLAGASTTLGQFPRLYVGETIPAIWDTQSGTALPCAGSPTKRSFIEYVHRRGVYGDFQIPIALETFTDIYGDEQVGGDDAGHVIAAVFRKTRENTAADFELVTLVQLPFNPQACCDNEIDGSVVLGTPGFMVSGSSQAMSQCMHGDEFFVMMLAKGGDQGTFILENATLHIENYGPKTGDQRELGFGANQSALVSGLGVVLLNDGINYKSSGRRVWGWDRRATGAGRFTDMVTFCPVGPTQFCPERDARANADSVFIGMRDTRAFHLVRVELKVTVSFVPVYSDLSTSSGSLSELSSQSSGSTQSDVSSPSSQSSQSTSSTQSESSLSTTSQSSPSTSANSSSSSSSTSSSSPSQSGPQTDQV